MPNRSREVERFMEGLDHHLKDEVERLRSAILDSNDRITEHIKWKAPSFCYAGEDRVTFQALPRRPRPAGLPSGRQGQGRRRGFRVRGRHRAVAGVADDRAVVALRDAEARQRDLVELVNRWVVT